MKTCLVLLALVVISVAGIERPASADHDHPTARAANRLVHRKAAHAVYAGTHAKAHYHNWKQRKGHKIRAWMNRH